MVCRAMRIDDVYAAGNTGVNQPAGTQAGKTQQAEKVGPGASRVEPAGGAAREADRVQLSELSEKLSQMLGAEAPGRAARLERLAAEVEAGKYVVDAFAVSRRLVDEALGGG